MKKKWFLGNAYLLEKPGFGVFVSNVLGEQQITTHIYLKYRCMFFFVHASLLPLGADGSISYKIYVLAQRLFGSKTDLAQEN